jgi:hypothetical protein
MEKIITVFGSALLKPIDNQYEKAVELGNLLANNKYTICSGGYGGIMEAVSKGVKSAGGNTIGITMDSVSVKPNEFIDENVIMPNWVERLMELIAIGDAYVVFKGGSGTLVEISALLEMMNKKIMKEKKIIFYSKFWGKVIDSINDDSKTLKRLIKNNVSFVNSVHDILKILKKLDPV